MKTDPKEFFPGRGIRAYGKSLVITEVDDPCSFYLTAIDSDGEEYEVKYGDIDHLDPVIPSPEGTHQQ